MTMTAYSIALFLHIVGALALFAAFALEGVALLGMRRAASAEQVREWASIFTLQRRIGPASLGVLLLAGLYMTATAWGRQAWTITGLATMFLLPLLGARSGARLAAVGRALATERGPLPTATHAQLNDPYLIASYQVRLAAALGIVFLMAVKPDLLGSLVTIGVALMAGLLVAMPAWRRGRAVARPS